MIEEEAESLFWILRLFVPGIICFVLWSLSLHFLFDWDPLKRARLKIASLLHRPRSSIITMLVLVFWWLLFMSPFALFTAFGISIAIAPYPLINGVTITCLLNSVLILMFSFMNYSKVGYEKSVVNLFLIIVGIVMIFFNIFMIVLMSGSVSWIGIGSLFLCSTFLPYSFSLWLNRPQIVIRDSQDMEINYEEKIIRLMGPNSNEFCRGSFILPLPWKVIVAITMTVLDALFLIIFLLERSPTSAVATFIFCLIADSCVYVYCVLCKTHKMMFRALIIVFIIKIYTITFTDKYWLLSHGIFYSVISFFIFYNTIKYMLKKRNSFPRYDKETYIKILIWFLLTVYISCETGYMSHFQPDKIGFLYHYKIVIFLITFPHLFAISLIIAREYRNDNFEKPLGFYAICSFFNILIIPVIFLCFKNCPEDFMQKIFIPLYILLFSLIFLINYYRENSDDIFTISSEYLDKYNNYTIKFILMVVIATCATACSLTTDSETYKYTGIIFASLVIMFSFLLSGEYDSSILTYVVPSVFWTIFSFLLMLEINDDYSIIFTVLFIGYFILSNVYNIMMIIKQRLTIKKLNFIIFAISLSTGFILFFVQSFFYHRMTFLLVSIIFLILFIMCFVIYILKSNNWTFNKKSITLVVLQVLISLPIPIYGWIYHNSFYLFITILVVYILILSISYLVTFFFFDSDHVIVYSAYFFPVHKFDHSLLFSRHHVFNICLPLVFSSTFLWGIYSSLLTVYKDLGIAVAISSFYLFLFVIIVLMSRRDFVAYRGLQSEYARSRLVLAPVRINLELQNIEGMDNGGSSEEQELNSMKFLRNQKRVTVFFNWMVKAILSDAPDLVNDPEYDNEVNQDGYSNLDNNVLNQPLVNYTDDSNVEINNEVVQDQDYIPPPQSDPIEAVLLPTNVGQEGVAENPYINT